MVQRDLEFWDQDEWKSIISGWPPAVNRGFAARLRIVQNGGQPPSHAKPLGGFAVSVWELWHRSGQRIIYTIEYANLTNHVDVLDAFLKDSRDGRKMRTSDKERIKTRVNALKRRMDELKAHAAVGRQTIH